MIAADRFLLDGDTAWLIAEILPNSGKSFIKVGGVAYRPQALDRPCETCGGERLGLPKSDPRAMDCHCIDGRHTFTVDAEVDGGFSYVTLRVSIVPGMVLPIAHSSDCELDNTDPHICHWPPTWILYGSDSPYHSVALPSAAAPGIWAVKLRVAS